MRSKQAPRHVRLEEANRSQQLKESQTGNLLHNPLTGLLEAPPEEASQKTRRLSHTNERLNLAKALKASQTERPSDAPSNKAEDVRPAAAPLPSPPLTMRCHARTRVPTPHGEVFLHVYKNNRDSKEHLAFVFDKKQLADTSSDATPKGSIRSLSLDAQWRPDETQEERIVRGAYVGRLSATASTASKPIMNPEAREEQEPTLVRIHSECFTGETIGSQRCDCGEQLDEAFRLISTCEAQRGIIVYLRQEGRGIGLLEKMRAYNLQDLGHDTVSANLLLGHDSDMRTYDLAAAILKDLGIASVRLLTNNPDKVTQAESEGIRVVERVPMVPRGWRMTADRAAQRSKRRQRQRRRLSKKGIDSTDDCTSETDSEAEEAQMSRSAGVGMIGGSTTASTDLDTYLRTKVQRMGHLLDIPAPYTQPSTPDLSDGPEINPLTRLRPKKSRKPTKLADSLTDFNTDAESIKSTPEVSENDSSHPASRASPVPS